MFRPDLKIWMNGEFVNLEDAKVSILSHALHYGSSFFEGIRCYETKTGPAVFRLKEHTDRLFNSTKMYRTEIPFTRDEINDAILETIRANNMKSCYIRPLVYRGFKTMGVNPFPCPVEVMIAVWEWGAYLGPEALEKGVDVKISTWTKLAPNTMPTMAKSGANYMNSQLIKMEAIVDGYDEGICLNTRGHVSEGSGENIFLLKDDKLHTPPTPNQCSRALPEIPLFGSQTKPASRLWRQPFPVNGCTLQTKFSSPEPRLKLPPLLQ